MNNATATAATSVSFEAKGGPTQIFDPGAVGLAAFLGGISGGSLLVAKNWWANGRWGDRLLAALITVAGILGDVGLITLLILFAVPQSFIGLVYLGIAFWFKSAYRSAFTEPKQAVPKSTLWVGVATGLIVFGIKVGVLWACLA